MANRDYMNVEGYYEQTAPTTQLIRDAGTALVKKSLEAADYIATGLVSLVTGGMLGGNSAKSTGEEDDRSYVRTSNAPQVPSPAASQAEGFGRTAYLSPEAALTEVQNIFKDNPPLNPREFAGIVIPNSMAVATHAVNNFENGIDHLHQRQAQGRSAVLG